MEKGQYCPLLQKRRKQNFKNYCPVSLLPICGKVFERQIFNKMFSFFLANDLLAPSQSGFKPGHSCINHLLSFTHEIYSSFDDRLDLKLEVFSWICLKPSIKSGMKGLCFNFSKTVFRMTC